MLSTIKQLHVLFAVLTVVLFTIRGVLMVRGTGWQNSKFLTVIPHVNDTLLLITGLVLATGIYGAFYYQMWLLAKIAAIIVFIVLGSIALKRGRTKGIRVLALLGSFLVLVYLLAVAINKTPTPFMQ